MLLIAFQSHPQPETTPLSTALGILLFHCASNRVLGHTSALNRISEQNSWRSRFAAFRVDNDFRRYRKPRDKSDDTPLQLAVQSPTTRGRPKSHPDWGYPSRAELEWSKSSRRVSHFSASRMPRSTYSLMLISSALPTGRSRFRTCQELRQAEEHAGQQKAPESRQTRPDDPAGVGPGPRSGRPRAPGWDTLVIPQSLCEKVAGLR